MQIDIDLIDIALNEVFNAVGLTYKLRLTTNTGLYENTIDFNTASLGSVPMSTTTYFAVPSGITVTGVKVFTVEDSTFLIEKTVTSKTFTSNGTYTVSSLIVSLGV